MRKLLLSGLCVFFSQAALSETSVQSLEWAARFLGVSSSQIQSFFDSMSRPLTGSSGAACVHEKSNTFSIQNRDSLLDCLSQPGHDLDEKLFAKLFGHNEILRQKTLDTQLDKTILLNDYLMDLIRQKVSVQKPASWYSRSEGAFTSSLKAEEGPLQNGDILVNFGGGGTSGLITRATSTALRASHGVVFNQQGQDFYVLESLPHTGARKNSFSEYMADKNYHITVLRWKSPNERHEVAQKSIELAQAWTEQAVPFDPTFSSLGNDGRLYCTLMTGLAYAKASQKPLEQLFPQNLNRMPGDVTVIAEQIIAPLQKQFLTAGALMQSPYFEMQAEYRDLNHLYQSWQIDIVTELVREKVQQGYRIKPHWFYQQVSWLTRIPLINRIPILAKARKLQDLIGKDKFANLATYERKIVEKVISNTNSKLETQNLLQVSLWKMRNRMATEFESIFADHMVQTRMTTLTQAPSAKVQSYE